MKTNATEFLKNLMRPTYYRLLALKLAIYSRLDSHVPFYQIPIIINNRNRVTSLKQLITSLEQRGYKNIYIIDNASSYPPLLKFYEEICYPIFFLSKNVGHLALWETGLYKRFVHSYYVYTDSDIVIAESCPSNFLDIFRKTMDEDKSIAKIGLSLKIDDLPNAFKNKQEVIKFESQYFQNRISTLFYEANVDTTFALYRPGLKHAANKFLKMFRSAYPMEARHMPWYIDSENIQEEEQYYIENATTSTHWTRRNK